MGTRPSTNDSPEKSTPGAIRGRRARGLARDGSAAEGETPAPGNALGGRFQIGPGVGKDSVAAPDVARCIAAPEELGLDTRVEFREGVIRELNGLPDGAALAIDLTPTLRVDSAGLSALMLVQRHAETRGQRVVLQNPSDELRFLLALTHMADLFDVEPKRP